jgi:hypothetical protein
MHDCGSAASAVGAVVGRAFVRIHDTNPCVL